MLSHLRLTAWSVVAAASAGLAGASATQAAPMYQTVALTGQQAPGAEAGVFYGQLLSPTANGAGQVAYLASLTDGDGNFLGHAAYGGPAVAPLLAARSGAQAPDRPPGEVFTSLLSNPAPFVNDSGQVAYHAFTSSLVALNGDALFAGPPLAQTYVARQGDQAPGYAEGFVYGSVGKDVFRVPTINDAGQIAYFARIAAPGQSVFEQLQNEALYFGAPDSPMLVARNGEQAHGAPTGVLYNSFGGLAFNPPAINDDGHVAYFASLTGTGVDGFNNLAIFAGPADAPTIVARGGDPASGAPAGVNYRRPDEPVINDRGEVAFHTLLRGAGVGSGNDGAIYFGAPGALTLVAREGEAAPGLPAGVNYSTLDESPSIDDQGRITYVALLKNGDVDLSNNEALFGGAFDSTGLIHRESDQAPGAPDGVTFSDFFFPMLNDTGQIGFLASVQGDGVGAANDLGLFLHDPLLGTFLIAREGDLFDLGDGDKRVVAQDGVGFHPNSNTARSGRSDDTFGGMMDYGLAFSLNFTDGSSGVFTFLIADPQAPEVPEPASALLLSVGAVALALRKRKRS